MNETSTNDNINLNRLAHLFGKQRFSDIVSLTARIDPEDLDARKYLIAACYKTGNLARASRLLEEHLQQVGTDPLCLFLQGVIELDFRYWQNAIDLFNQVQTENIDMQKRLHHYRGLANYHIGNYIEAQRDFSEWVQLQPDCLAAHHNLAATAVAAGRPSLASDAAARCIEIDDSRAGYYVKLLTEIGKAQAREETSRQVHRFKNLMTVLGSDFRRALADMPESEQALNPVIRRQEKLMKNLSTYLATLRPSNIELDLVDLRDEFDELLLGLSSQYKNVSFRRRFSDGDYKIVGDRFGLKEALLNLLKNACDALPQGGTVTIQGLPDSHQVVLTIQDSGTGITPEQATQVFLPGYSTKPFGSGFGLPQAKMAIETSGGKLTLLNNRQPGACFEVRHHRFPTSDNSRHRFVPLAVGQEDISWWLD